MHGDRRRPIDGERPSGSDRSVAAILQPAWVLKLFGTMDFFRLWIVQVVSATGDWLGFFAIVAAATRVGGGTPEAAVGFVMTARVVPGLFLAPLAGVLVDRWDRKRVMIFCDVGRAMVLLWLPFVDQLWQLVVASLLMEALTLLWAPAKEASVPHIVPKEHLTTANSLSMAAAYGTIPLASLLYSQADNVAERLAGAPGADFFRFDQESLAFYLDAVTFLVAALLIATLTLPRRSRDEREATVDGERVDLLGPLRELREGWQFIFLNPVVRSVNLALATGLIGGGMLIPLGPIFAEEVLGEDPGDGFATLQTALGFGVAIGVVMLSVSQRRLNKTRTFVLSVFGAGVSLFVATSMTSMLPSAFLVGCLGLFAGAVYVLGFTLLHEHVADELRGRIFSSLYTLVRLSIIAALAVGPFLALLLNGLSEEFADKSIRIGGADVFIPGVRLTLWLAAIIILIAAVLAWLSVRHELREARTVRPITISDDQEEALS